MDKLILIVEDDPKNLSLFRDLLQKFGYMTIEAENGREGVNLARANKPELILMDIQLPVMDGLEATRILKSDAKTKNIPILALTSYAMKGDREKILQAGCDGYLAKPINIQELIATVARYFPSKVKKGVKIGGKESSHFGC
ncbi:Polar-differentiation response regulator DivK [subsurface metagenome]